MPVDLPTLLTAIKDSLAGITDLNIRDFAPDQVTPPVAWVDLPPIPDYFKTMNKARVELAPTVTVATSRVLDRGGQMKLAGYANPAGATSVHAALMADRTLGGNAEECVVAAFRPLGRLEVAQVGYFGGVFTLMVIARGN